MGFDFEKGVQWAKGARVLVHPHCAENKAAGERLTETLRQHGYDTDRIAVYQAPTARRSDFYELVRVTDAGHIRMDGLPV